MTDFPIDVVWIEDGCIPCGACESAAPLVFFLSPRTAHVLGSARVDGATDQNPGRSPLRVKVRGLHDEAIAEAVDGCPVEVIKFNRSAVPSPSA